MAYKKSRRGGSEIDRAAAHVLRNSGRPHRLLDYRPDGYDERQYCSPGFDLPVGRLSRTPSGEYPEYHTSADDLLFVSAEALEESYGTARGILDVLEGNKLTVNLNPKCEPQLGRRGLYAPEASDNLALLWVLSRSDGRSDLLEIADGAGLPFSVIEEAARRLVQAGLLAEKKA
jgi:aminopeptidase-like protein